jgi:anti-sigma factor RsiW
MLDHLKATKRNVADRYVLGELSQAQREEFEEHYFECVDCAEDVRAFLAISSNSRSVLVDVLDCAEPAPAPRWTPLGWFHALRSWRPPAIYAIAPALAMLALTAITTYQSITLRSQLVAQAVPQFDLRPDARGDEGEIRVQPSGNFLVLAADVPGVPRVVKWQIRRVGSQIPLMNGTTPAPPPGASLSVLIPASKLGTGQYVLAVRPDGISQETGSEILYRFRMH